MGKVLLSALPAAEVNKLIEVDRLHKRTAKTIADRSRFLQAVAFARERGYSMSDEEQFVGVRSVAVPIHDPSGRVYAALAAVGFSVQPAWKDIDQLVDLLQRTARQMSVRSQRRPK